MKLITSEFELNFQREAAFEHADSKTVVAMPQPNGTIYTFGRDVNILWRHGILQVGCVHVQDIMSVLCVARCLLSSRRRRGGSPS